MTLSTTLVLLARPLILGIGLKKTRTIPKLVGKQIYSSINMRRSLKI